jgi:hypothetical protein
MVELKNREERKQRRPTGGRESKEEKVARESPM